MASPSVSFARGPTAARMVAKYCSIAAYRGASPGAGGVANEKCCNPAAETPAAVVVHTAWRVHRALYRVSGGRFVWTTSNKRGWGTLRLTTIGRKSGQERSVIIGYLEDGPDLVALAMNGWDEGHAAWWLNLEAHPDAVIRLAHQEPRLVRARCSVGEERDRLWQRWVAVDPRLDAYAARRSTETPVIVLEPRNRTA
jgi:F420H(2)-dependent quinone reductase